MMITTLTQRHLQIPTCFDATDSTIGAAAARWSVFRMRTPPNQKPNVMFISCLGMEKRRRVDHRTCARLLRGTCINAYNRPT